MRKANLILTAVFCLIFCVTTANAKQVVLKMGGVVPLKDVAATAANKMAEIVDEMSQGSLKLEIYHASQLGDAISQMESMSLGSQDMMFEAGSWMSQYVPDKQVENIFKIFRSEEHYRKYLASDIYKEMEEKFRKKTGIKVTSNNWLRAPRNIASNKPVKSMADFKGLKIRAPQIKTYITSLQALGTSPTQIPWGEVYIALSQKVVDAAENPTDALYSSKVMEACSSLLLTEHIRDNIVIYISDAKFNSLSDEHKKILVDAGNKAGEFYTASVAKKSSEIINILEKQGKQINSLSDADNQKFAEMVLDKAKSLEEEGMWRKGLLKEISSMY